MNGKDTYKKHNINSRQPSEQHKTKTWKQHECKSTLKHRRHTKNETNIYKGSRLGMISDKSHFDKVYERSASSLSHPYPKTSSVNKDNSRQINLQYKQW